MRFRVRIVLSLVVLLGVRTAYAAPQAGSQVVISASSGAHRAEINLRTSLAIDRIDVQGSTRFAALVIRKNNKFHAQIVWLPDIGFAYSKGAGEHAAAPRFLSSGTYTFEIVTDKPVTLVIGRGESRKLSAVGASKLAFYFATPVAPVDYAEPTLDVTESYDLATIVTYESHIGTGVGYVNQCLTRSTLCAQDDGLSGYVLDDPAVGASGGLYLTDYLPHELNSGLYRVVVESVYAAAQDARTTFALVVQQ
jgi:hypothetical protein